MNTLSKKNRAIEILNKAFELTSKDKSKSTFIWKMGTDWFISFKLFDSMIKIIKEKGYSFEKNEIYIEIESTVEETIYAKKKYKTSNKLWFTINIYQFTNNDELEKVDKIDLFFNKSNLFSTNRNLNYKKSVRSWGAMKQYLQIWYAFGLISKYEVSGNVNKKDRKYKLNTDYTFGNNNEEILTNIMNVSNDIFNIKYKRGMGNVRDIIVSMYLSICMLNDYLTYDDLYNLKYIYFSGNSYDKKSITPDVINTIIKSDSTQTTIKKNINDLFNKNFHTIEKIISDGLDKLSSSEILEQNIYEHINKKYNRPGQSNYRNSALIASKRWVNTHINKFNVLDLNIGIGVFDPRFVVASHIVDYAEANEVEKYDPENCLLLDPSTHKYFDDDKLIFNENGEILVQKDSFEIFEHIIAPYKGKKIREQVLTQRTKDYIKKRIINRAININDYIVFK